VPLALGTPEEVVEGRLWYHSGFVKLAGLRTFAREGYVYVARVLSHIVGHGTGGSGR
jgi:hypothetical protein